MASAGVAQCSQADPEIVCRLEAEVKRLGERDLKRQAKLDDLVKAKNSADKEHAERHDPFRRSPS